MTIIILWFDETFKVSFRIRGSRRDEQQTSSDRITGDGGHGSSWFQTAAGRPGDRQLVTTISLLRLAAAHHVA